MYRPVTLLFRDNLLCVLVKLRLTRYSGRRSPGIRCTEIIIYKAVLRRISVGVRSDACDFADRFERGCARLAKGIPDPRLASRVHNFEYTDSPSHITNGMSPNRIGEIAGSDFRVSNVSPVACNNAHVVSPVE